MSQQKTILSGAAVMLWVAGTAFGAGYGIYEGSARGNAMGSEVTADPVSPSVVYNNVAGMTELEGMQLESGLTIIKPRQTVKMEMPEGEERAYGYSKWWVIPNAYATRQISDRWWAGIGAFTRVGLGAKYPDGWQGRYSVQKAEITSFDLNPSVAYKVTDRFSLGAGFRVEYFDFLLSRAVPTGKAFADPDVLMEITGDNYGMGYNLGAFWKATDRVSFGLAYESEVTQEIKGEYKLSSSAGPVVGSGAAYGDFPVPALIRLGTSVQATEKLKLNAGVVYTMWSCYDALTIHFDPALPGNKSVTSARKEWHDTFRWQFGGEYALNEAWVVRCGYVYDKTPDPDYLVDYMVPANDRHIFSVGGGWKHGDFFCDLTGTFLHIENRVVNGHLADGVWDGGFENGDAYMLSASIGYKL